MTKSVADYQVLFDGGFTLDAATNDREKNLTFILPTNFKIEDGIRKPILAFHGIKAYSSSLIPIFVAKIITGRKSSVVLIWRSIPAINLPMLHPRDAREIVWAVDF